MLLICVRVTTSTFSISYYIKQLLYSLGLEGFASPMFLVLSDDWRNACSSDGAASSQDDFIWNNVGHQMFYTLKLLLKVRYE